MNGSHRIRWVVACTLLAATLPGHAVTQDEVDEARRVQQLEEARKAAAEARQAAAEAEAARARAELGTLDTSKLTKPSGEATSLNVESKILAYAAVERIATAIAKSVVASAGKTTPIVVHTDKEINALQQGRAFLAGIKLLDAQMAAFEVPELAADNADCSEPAKGGAAALGALGPLGLLDVGLQLASLFKVDKKLVGTDVTLDDFGLASAVLRRLKVEGVQRVAYPPLHAAGAFSGTDMFSKSESMKQLAALDTRQKALDARLAQISARRNGLAAREADTRKKLPAACASAFSEARQIYTSLEARAQALKERAGRYAAAATTIDDKTGATLLQVLLQAEDLASSYKGADLLKLSPLAAGGTTLNKTSLFSTRFRVGGGAVVSYMLVSGQDGAVKDSGTLAEYGGSLDPEDLQNHLLRERGGAAAEAGR